MALGSPIDSTSLDNELSHTYPSYLAPTVYASQTTQQWVSTPQQYYSHPVYHQPTDGIYQQPQPMPSMSLPSTPLNAKALYLGGTSADGTLYPATAPLQHTSSRPPANTVNSNVTGRNGLPAGVENARFESTQRTSENGHSYLSGCRNSRHRQFQCYVPGCPNKRGFGRFCDLQRHSRTVHGTSRPFECTYCCARFKRRDHLRTHEAVVHVSKGHKISGNSNKGAVSL